MKTERVLAPMTRERSRRTTAAGSRRSRGATSRHRRWVGIVALMGLAGVAVVGTPAIREGLLRAAGWALVVDEPVERAVDIVVVAIDAVGGVFDAADMIHGGVAGRVAIFADPPDAVDLEFIRRGIPYEDGAARSARQLRSLGVTAIEQIARVDGTEAEGQVLPAWCDQHHFRSIVVVSSADHSRRLRRVLHRAMKGHQTRVTIHAVRHWGFDPDQWWKTRNGIRSEIVELQKLLLDIIRYPLF
jgi:hypothetical protein